MTTLPTKMQRRARLPDLDDLVHGQFKVTQIAKSDSEPRRCYRVLLRGVIVDIVEGQEGWGCLPARKAGTPAPSGNPLPPFGSLMEAVATAGATLHTAANV